MKHKASKLTFDNGCFGCKKPCQYNGLRVDAESHRAVKKDKDQQYIQPKDAEMYGCNSAKG